MEYLLCLRYEDGSIGFEDFNGDVPKPGALYDRAGFRTRVLAVIKKHSAATRLHVALVELDKITNVGIVAQTSLVEALGQMVQEVVDSLSLCKKEDALTQ